MGISIDEGGTLAELVERLDLCFALLSVSVRRVMTGYGVADSENELAVPSVFIIDRDGTILWRHVGETMADRPPVEQVLEALAR